MQDRDFLRASVLHARAAHLVLTNYLPPGTQSIYCDLDNLANITSIAVCPNMDQLIHYLNMTTDREILRGIEAVQHALEETTQYNTCVVDNATSIMLAIINGLTTAYCTVFGIEAPTLRRNTTDPEHPTFEFPDNLTCRICGHPLEQHYSRCSYCGTVSANDSAIPTGIPLPRVDAKSDYDFPQYPIDPRSAAHYAVLRAIYIITKSLNYDPIHHLAKQALQRMASVRYENLSVFTSFINDLMCQLMDRHYTRPFAIVNMINEMAITLDPVYVKRPPLNAAELCHAQPTSNIHLPKITGERCAICGATITHEGQLLAHYNGCSECTSMATCVNCENPLPLYHNPDIRYLITCGWSLAMSQRILTCGSCGIRQYPHNTPVQGNSISIRPVLPPIVSKRKHTIGVEVEGSADIRGRSITGWEIGSDHSIRGLPYPVELRSHIIESTELHKFLQASHGILSQITVNNTCGLHIHIGANGLSWFDIYHIMIYCTVYEPVFTATQPPSRRNGRYCTSLTVPAGVKTKKEFYETMYKKGNVRSNRGEKYPSNANITRDMWLNVHARLYHGTLEFRLHSGTSDIRKIHHWIQFLISSVEHAIYVHPSKWDTPLNVCPEQTRTYMVERIKRFGGQATFNRVDPSYTYSILEGTKKGSDIINTFGTVKLVRPAELS